MRAILQGPLLSLIFPNPLKTLDFRGFLTFFLEGKLAIKGWKKERKRERRWRGFGGDFGVGEGGFSSSFLEFFLGFGEEKERGGRGGGG